MVSIIFDPDGNVRHIYDDSLVELDRALGEFHVKRASHVEPTEDGMWTADMSPVGGPLLGPFRTHEIALAKEKAWLQKHDVPEVQD